MSSKKACVVGAGASGIAALKECIRHGFKSTCYELDSDVGGTWLKKDYSKPTNTPAVWDSLITNSSKFNSCYSDYPPQPEDTPYLTAEAMLKYFRRAVIHFDLEKYIQFNTRVVKIKKTSDHEQTGKWEVYTAERGSELAGSDLAGPRCQDDGELSMCHREVFDFVLVCSGYFKIPSYPNIEGLDTFKGTVHHSFNYEGPKPFDGQSVLVVGNKLSAADIASDIANLAKQVFLAVGKGMWIIPKCFSNARTLDLLFPRSILHSSKAVIHINNRIIQEAESKIDHTTTGIRQDKPPLFAPFGLSDDLPIKILAGKVQVYGRLTLLEGDKAYFHDGKCISGINSVLFCTGYKPDLSFLDMDIFDESGKMETFKMIFPLNQKHNSLALIGNVAGDAPLALLYELQARLATLVMSGRHKLPSQDKMKRDVDFWNDHNFARNGGFHSYFVSAALLTECTAQEIGCYPTFWKVFLRDPILAFRNWYGPILCSQYRLVGPDSQWKEASQTCHRHYNERYSSVSHMGRNSFCRTDIYDYYKSRLLMFVAFSSLSAAVGVIFYKYQKLVLN